MIQGSYLFLELLTCLGNWILLSEEDLNEEFISLCLSLRQGTTYSKNFAQKHQILSTMTNSEIWHKGLKGTFCSILSYSGSDISILVKDAVYEPLRISQKAKKFRKVKNEKG